MLEDVFAVQDEVAASVGEAMSVTLLPRRAEEIPSDFESYELELKARQAAFQQSKSGLQQALVLYDQLLAKDHTNARGLAGKARTLLTYSAYSHEVRSAFHEAAGTAKRALVHDPNSAEAHEVLGWIAGGFHSDFQKSLEYGRRAHELAPNSSHILYLGQIRVLRGR